MKSDVKNLKLADRGRARVEWAAREMPVLASIREDFAKRKPLRNVKLGACLHVTAETANLMITLKAGGASLTLRASNPLSTQGEVAAAIVQHYKNIWGSSEETTTGVIRLKSLAKSGKLKFPVIAVNDSKVKYLFDNRYG